VGVQLFCHYYFAIFRLKNGYNPKRKMNKKSFTPRLVDISQTDYVTGVGRVDELDPLCESLEALLVEKSDPVRVEPCISGVI
jgi:hypothetical protein